MTNKYTKICSATLVIGEMQIKITVITILHPLEGQKFQSLKISSVDGNL